MSELKFSKKKQTGNKVIDVPEYKAATTKESDIQRQCEQLLDLMHLEYYRIPDAAWKNKIPHVRKILSHYLKGKPDLLVMKPFDDVYIKAVAFELKSKKGVLTGGQKAFQRKLPMIIIRSFEEFSKQLDNFLREKDETQR